MIVGYTMTHNAIPTYFVFTEKGNNYVDMALCIIVLPAIVPGLFPSFFDTILLLHFVISDLVS